MDSSQSLDEKIKIDNSLSNRYIDLDPNGYFIIKVDLEENKIILEHFLNNINDEGYPLDPETNEPIKSDSQNKRLSNQVFEGPGLNIEHGRVWLLSHFFRQCSILQVVSH